MSGRMTPWLVNKSLLHSVTLVGPILNECKRLFATVTSVLPVARPQSAVSANVA
jgi:hypothetical protein